MLAVLLYRQIPYRLMLASDVTGGEVYGLPALWPALHDRLHAGLIGRSRRNTLYDGLKYAGRKKVIRW
jgi:hypothetical protein